ncbi:tRNA (guanosine(46)-N7)-methyltransferase TrmB [Aquirufa sp. A-Brett2-15D]
MSRRKTAKYNLALELDNVIQEPKTLFGVLQGKWKSDLFENENRLVLELGCGRGEYTNGLGKLFPEMNFVGIDVKGDRLAQGGRAARELELSNTAFLRIHMQEIEAHFAENEVDEIWITFPDPRLRDRDEKRRLTFHTFLNRYKRILKPGGTLHLKTDSLPFFEFSEESLAANGWETIVKTNDLYNSEWNEDHYGIKTRFEQMFHEKGFSINYLRAKNLK